MLLNLFPRIVFIQEDEQLHVKSFTRRWVVNGPRKYWLMPFWQAEKRIGMTLGPTEYLKVRNTVTGELRNEIGPMLFLPDANDEILEQREAIALKHNEYVRLKDTKTGEIRVVRGEGQVYLSPTETFEKAGPSVQPGINIDEETAALVRDTQTGQLRLVTEKQVFVPEPNQELVDIRQRIRLEENEAVIIKDKHGRYEFRKGSDEERSFFLDPYSELISLNWSSGLHKEKRGLRVTKVDLRPKYMWYEFEARTKDNVDLIIGITCFWGVADVEAMILSTDDAPGDLCSHVRSGILQRVSQVTLESFLAGFNEIVHRAVLTEGDDFYAKRGISLHSVEVRSITCGDEDTQHVLQEIINETTQRINRMQKQESENEVELHRMRGEIETEEKRAKLLAMRRNNAQTEGLITGESEALRVKAFLDGLGTELSPEQKLSLFESLRRRETYSDLSRGNAQLFLVPEDSDLTVRTK